MSKREFFVSIQLFLTKIKKTYFINPTVKQADISKILKLLLYMRFKEFLTAFMCIFSVFLIKQWKLLFLSIGAYGMSINQ